MPMTIRELLAEPQLGLTLTAGESGLERQLTWSHTSDLPKLWEWISDGVLLLTNGLSIPADAGGQVDLARRLSAAGAAGLAVGDKMHAPDLTPEFLQACDELPLPLLSVPYPLPFIAISRSIAEALHHEEAQRVKQTARIYDLLRRASTPQAAWRQLTADLCRELGCRLFVLDDRCLHPWSFGDVAPNWRLHQGILLAREQAAEANRHFQWFDHAGQAILLMDIPTHEHALLVIAPPQDAAHPDTVVLLHTATVLGLALSHRALATEGQRRAGESVLLQLLHGGGLTPGLEPGLDSENLRLACFSLDGDSVAGDVGQRLRQHGIANAYTHTNEAGYLLFDAASNLDIVWHVLADQAAAGVSETARLNELQRALREARWARAHAQSHGARTQVYSEQISWLGIPGYVEGEELADRLLGKLLDYDQRTGSDLLGTLRLYLQLQRSAQKVAAATYTHRQTVISRLRKISELTGLNLSETAVIAQLWLALQVHDALTPGGARPSAGTNA